MKTTMLNSFTPKSRWLIAAVVGFASTLALTALASSPYAGVYNGTYTATSGSSEQGIFALCVDGNGWCGFVHVSQQGNGGGYEQGFAVSSGGNISFSSSDGTVIHGTISGGSLTGTWAGSDNSGSLSGTARAASGTYQSSAGYYEGAAGGGTIRVILAPDGAFYGGVDDGLDGDGFASAMNANQFSFTSVQGAAVSGSLNTTSHVITGNASDSGSNTPFTLNRTHSLTGAITPWPDATDLGGGWMRSGWFGDFNTSTYPWIYHAQHGWMYTFGTDPSSIWLYDQTGNMGFLWTGSGVYPWMWSDQKGTWLYYSKGSSSPRWFFNWNTQTWERH